MGGLLAPEPGIRRAASWPAAGPAPCIPGYLCLLGWAAFAGSVTRMSSCRGSFVQPLPPLCLSLDGCTHARCRATAHLNLAGRRHDLRLIGHRIGKDQAHPLRTYSAYPLVVLEALGSPILGTARLPAPVTRVAHRWRRAAQIAPQPRREDATGGGGGGCKGQKDKGEGTLGTYGGGEETEVITEGVK